jgi:hypothetical protein
VERTEEEEDNERRRSERACKKKNIQYGKIGKRMFCIESFIKDKRNKGISLSITLIYLLSQKCYIRYISIKLLMLH